MSVTATQVDSSSVGDPARFLTLAHLQRQLEALEAAPADTGRVAFVMRRGAGGLRETPAEIRLVLDSRGRGRRLGPQGATGPADADRRDAAGRRRVDRQRPARSRCSATALFLELDLSTANLPAGSRLRVGAALLEVTPAPHNGCRKFQARFGAEALRFVSSPQWRQRNLRGIYMRVIEAGTVRPGDPVSVLARA